MSLAPPFPVKINIKGAEDVVCVRRTYEVSNTSTIIERERERERESEEKANKTKQKLIFSPFFFFFFSH